MKTVKNSQITPLPKKENRRPLIYVVVVESIVLGLFLYFHLIMLHKADEKEKKYALAVSQSELADQKMTMVRNDEFKFIKPLFLTDVRESEKLSSLKNNISQLIELKRQSGMLINASVYYRKLKDGSWTSVNSDEKYRPGSINKIPLMMYFLKMSEMQPGLLDMEFVYNQPIANPKNETYQECTMLVGKSYKVRDLLYKMIVNSDNIATTLLLLHMDKPDIYQKIYLDLKMPVPQPRDFNFCLSATDVSKFMRVLYSSTFLTEKNSQFALDLLSKSTFTQGLVRSLPSNTIVARKFGESGLQETPEFSETGIVYDGDNTYLLTIMTKGTDSRQQAETIGEISKMVYDKVKE